MEKIKVDLIYPFDFSELDTKQLELTQLELVALLGTKKVGSEGRYFTVDEFIFEDTKEGYSVTVKLETEY